VFLKSNVNVLATHIKRWQDAEMEQRTPFSSLLRAEDEGDVGNWHRASHG
jgi:hypothetical protein